MSQRKHFLCYVEEGQERKVRKKDIGRDGVEGAVREKEKNTASI